MAIAVKNVEQFTRDAIEALDEDDLRLQLELLHDVAPLYESAVTFNDKAIIVGSALRLSWRTGIWQPSESVLSDLHSRAEAGREPLYGRQHLSLFLAIARAKLGRHEEARIILDDLEAQKTSKFIKRSIDELRREMNREDGDLTP